MPSDKLQVIFIGPPGSGKGTQGTFLHEEYGVCHLATGDMLRAAVKAGTDVGKQAKAVMERGELVSDDIMINLIKENIGSDNCKGGFILDGFPRTLPQAEKLDEMLTARNSSIDQALEFKVEDSLLVRRITGRWIHQPSGRSYHTEFAPPKVPGKDDVTGEDLIQRADDNEETLKKRLVAYHSQTAPVLEYYKKQDKLTTLPAHLSPDKVYATIKGCFNKIRN